MSRPFSPSSSLEDLPPTLPIANRTSFDDTDNHVDRGWCGFWHRSRPTTPPTPKRKRECEGCRRNTVLLILNLIATIFTLALVLTMCVFLLQQWSVIEDKVKDITKLTPMISNATDNVQAMATLVTNTIAPGVVKVELAIETIQQTLANNANSTTIVINPRL